MGFLQRRRDSSATSASKQALFVGSPGSPGSTRGGVTVSIVPSRTSGVAPLGVRFEASVTGSGVMYPFHELLYEWDFGYAAGNFAYGSTLENAKRFATGPVAAHVFQEGGTPGTRTVTLTVKRRTGGTTETIGTDSVVITATSSFTQFNVADKIVLYGSDATTAGAAIFTNVSVGDARNTTSVDLADIADDITNGVRAWIFKGGETFTFTSGDFSMTTGGDPSAVIGGQTAGWGSGKPTLAMTPSSGFGGFHWEDSQDGNDDCRLIQLIIDCGGATGSRAVRTQARLDHLLLLGIDARNTGSHCFECTSGNFVDEGFGTNHFIHGCVTGGGSSQGGSAIRWECDGLSVQGCDLDNSLVTATGTHVIRGGGLNAVWSHNDITGQNVDGATGQAFKFQGFSAGEVLGDPVVGTMVVGDNVITGHMADWIHIGNADTPSGEVFRDIILERNYLLIPATSNQTSALSRAVDIFGPDTARITVRNNVFDASNPFDSWVRAIELDDTEGGTLDLIWIYNNTLSNEDSPTVPYINVDAGATNVHCSNNLGSHDGGGGSPAAVTGSPDTNSNNVFVTDNPFSTNPPTAIAHFVLGAGASEIDGGGEVAGLFDDYQRDAISTTPNIGAFQTNA